MGTARNYLELNNKRDFAKLHKNNEARMQVLSAPKVDTPNMDIYGYYLSTRTILLFQLVIFLMNNNEIVNLKHVFDKL